VLAGLMASSGPGLQRARRCGGSASSFIGESRRPGSARPWARRRTAQQ